MICKPSLYHTFFGGFGQRFQIRSFARQQFQRPHQNRLSGTCFTCYDVQARMQINLELIDQDKVGNGEMPDHGSSQRFKGKSQKCRCKGLQNNAKLLYIPNQHEGTVLKFPNQTANLSEKLRFCADMYISSLL